MILNSIILIGLGFWFGYFYSNWSRRLSEKNEKLKSILDKNNQFNQILEKTKTRKTRFKTRVNNTVYIGIKLEDYGKVDILYFLDKPDIAIFKGDKLIITSEDVKKELLNEVMDNLYKTHYHRINDIVEVLGFIFYREDFEKNFNINLNEIKEKASQIMKMAEDNSDVQNIISNNSKKFNIDDILDKINLVGIENLTKEELEFLNNYNK